MCVYRKYWCILADVMHTFLLNFDKKITFHNCVRI